MHGRIHHNAIERALPALAPLSKILRDLSYLLMRISARGLLLTHGTIRVMTTTVGAHAAGAFARRGIEPALPLAYLVWFVKTAGAVRIVLGLFTRFFAAPAAIELAVIAFAVSIGREECFEVLIAYTPEKNIHVRLKPAKS